MDHLVRPVVAQSKLRSYSGGWGPQKSSLHDNTACRYLQSVRPRKQGSHRANHGISSRLHACQHPLATSSSLIIGRVQISSHLSFSVRAGLFASEDRRKSMYILLDSRGPSRTLLLIDLASCSAAVGDMGLGGRAALRSSNSTCLYCQSIQSRS